MNRVYCVIILLVQISKAVFYTQTSLLFLNLKLIYRHVRLKPLKYYQRLYLRRSHRRDVGLIVLLSDVRSLALNPPPSASQSVTSWVVLNRAVQGGWM